MTSIHVRFADIERARVTMYGQFSFTTDAWSFRECSIGAGQESKSKRKDLELHFVLCVVSKEKNALGGRLARTLDCKVFEFVRTYRVAFLRIPVMAILEQFVDCLGNRLNASCAFFSSKREW